MDISVIGNGFEKELKLDFFFFFLAHHPFTEGPRLGL